MAHRSLYLLGLLPSFLLAHPTVPEVVQGGATFAHPSEHQMIIKSNDSATIINWKTFSIDRSELSEFIQPDAHSAILNRVTSEDPSKIFGTLFSNGKIILINPNGIIFGENSLIDTNAFVASSLDDLDSEFKGGSMRFRGNSKEAIINHGTIKARNGDVALISRYIAHDGVISAPKGGHI